MTEIKKETVHYLADLARIAVTEDEEEALLSDLRKMVGYVEQLREVNTDNVAPCCYVTEGLTQTPLREDLVVKTLESSVFLELTPQKTAGMLRVPSVMKQE